MKPTSDQQEEMRRRWQPYGLSLEAGLKLRRRGQTDLFFLCTELLGYRKLKERPHREVCELFVKKDPDADSFEEFARAYPDLHERLLWLPRGGFKSTIDIGDNVQWIICFPDIRINVMTDRLDLAQEFVGGTKGHFTLNPDGTPRVLAHTGQPSQFQILFFEFCDTSSSTYAGNSSPKWTTPARRNPSILAPTIRAAGIDAGKTGTHCDIDKRDDTITPESVGTGKSVGTNLRNITTKSAMARSLRAPYGFTDNIGTPQHAQDYNSQIVAAEKKRLLEGQPPTVKMLIRPAYTIKPGFELGADGKPRTPPDLEDGMVDMWFPEEISLDFLKQEWALPGGRDKVATQYLLDVSLKDLAKFTREQLMKATVPYTMIPRSGLLVIPWDLAYSTKERADFTVGLPIVIAGGRFYVVDMVRGRYNEDELPKMIALTIYKHRPHRVAIENSQGAKWLRKGILEELKELGMDDFSIEYAEIGQGEWRRNEVNAQLTVRLLGTGRLLFSTAIPAIDSLYDELEAFPNPNHKDDIIACLNLGCSYFVSEEEMTVMQAHDEALSNSPNADLWHQRVYTNPGEYEVEPSMMAREVQRGYGLLPNVLGDLPE